MIIVGFLIFVNILAIREYNKYISLKEDVKYKIYPQNTIFKCFLLYAIIVISYEIWTLVHIFVIQNEVISFEGADKAAIIKFITAIMEDVGLIIVIITTIYILRRESFITENRIITRYGVFNFIDLNKIELEHKGSIRYELKKHTLFSGLSFYKFKVNENESREIAAYLNDRINTK